MGHVASQIGKNFLLRSYKLGETHLVASVEESWLAITPATLLLIAVLRLNSSSGTLVTFLDYTRGTLKLFTANAHASGAASQ